MFDATRRRSARSKLNQCQVLINTLIQKQIQTLVSNSMIRSLEIIWRELNKLTRGADSVKIKLLTIYQKEIIEDLKFETLEQSELFNKIAHQEFNHAGGEPYGLLLVCHDILDNKKSLKTLSEIAMQSFSPCLLSSHHSINTSKTISNQLKNPAMRFIGIVTHETLVRSPYQSSPSYARNHFFMEDEMQLLWSNSHFQLASHIVRCFTEDGWFHCITQRKDTALLNRSDYAPIRHHHAQKDDPIRCHYDPFTNEVHYDRCLTLHQDRMPLSIVLGISRFAHALKALARNKIGLQTTEQELQATLQQWLLNYCAMNMSITENPSQYPLKSADVRVESDRTRPGHFICHLQLNPYTFDHPERATTFQFEAQLTC